MIDLTKRPERRRESFGLSHLNHACALLSLITAPCYWRWALWMNVVWLETDHCFVMVGRDGTDADAINPLLRRAGIDDE